MIKPINDLCIEPEVNFCILYSNGTTEVAKVDYSIPELNFCIGPFGSLLFQFKRILSDTLAIIYINSTDLTSASYYMLLVTQTGKVIRFVTYLYTVYLNAFKL